jgi:hypothetical protein
MTTIRRKQLVRAVECDPKQTPHGVNPALVFTLHPNGTLTIRPKRSRSQPVVSFHLAKLYARGLGEMFT